MGLFIQVWVAQDQVSPALGRSLAALCPVDIFALDGERLRVQPQQEDECTLCELCLNAAPAGAIVIEKLYKTERLTSRGPASAPGG